MAAATILLTQTFLDLLGRTHHIRNDDMLNIVLEVNGNGTVVTRSGRLPSETPEQAYSIHVANSVYTTVLAAWNAWATANQTLFNQQSGAAIQQGNVGGNAQVVAMAGTGTTVATATQAAGNVLLLQGAITADVVFQLPLNAGQEWTVINQLTGNFACTVQGPTGAGIAIAGNGSNTAARLTSNGARILRTSADVVSTA